MIIYKLMFGINHILKQSNYLKEYKGGYLKMSEIKDIVDKTLEDINMSEFVNRYIKEEEEKRWKDEHRFNSFLKYLINYVDINKRVLSDDFYYEDDKPYGSREFESYLNSLYDIIHKYSKKNFINDRFLLTNEDMFSEHSYCVKIKDKFYHIELVCGQGSYVIFELVENKNNDFYVDYDLMMADKKTPFYEENLKLIVEHKLEQLISSLVQHDVDRELVKKIIKEY